jgi:hypothetical protein
MKVSESPSEVYLTHAALFGKHTKTNIVGESLANHLLSPTNPPRGMRTLGERNLAYNSDALVRELGDGEVSE